VGPDLDLRLMDLANAELQMLGRIKSKQKNNKIRFIVIFALFNFFLNNF
jgi:hypothetical protein